jgi:hypothetical protein
MSSLRYLLKIGVLFEDRQLFDKLLQEFPTLHQILDKFGVNTNKVKLLSGSGSHGVAFTDGNLVIKITDDESEAHASSKIASQLISGVNQIHYVGKFARELPYHDPEVTNELVPYYVIIQDMADTKVSPAEKYWADRVGDFLVMNKAWPFDVSKAVSNIYHTDYRKTGKNPISPSNTTIINSLLTNVLELYKQGVKYLDVSSNNIGHDKDGRLVIFDLGVSETKPMQIATIS